MSTNYSEQIFQSIDTIISQRLNEVSFDKTEICEIVSQDKDNVNKYWVSNGSLKYEAYSIDENRKYLANQKVYVTIPQGNYDLRKLIIGSYSADETNENLYVNPFNHLVTSSSHEVSDIIITTNTSGNSTSNFKDLNIRFNYSNTIDFDYIGLEFGLDTSSLQGTYKGTYSIELQIYNNEDEQLNTSRIILYNTDLYGNPYSLIPMLKFQHLFPFPKEIKKITDIAKIRVLLAQDGNFEKIGNIKLQDIKLYFGYDTKTITKDKLQLILAEGQNLKYTTGQTAAARNLYLDWKHFDTSNTPYIFNIHQSPNIFEYYKVYWLHYVDGLGKNADLPDKYAWNWETITNNTGLTQDIALTTLYRTDQYKAVIKYKYQNNETIYYAESTGLIFENTQVTAQPGATNNSDESLRLSLAKGDTGIYNIYGLDGRMVDTSKKNRTITAAFLDKTSWNDKKIETVIWKFPDSNTMILNGVQDPNNKNKATFDINSYYKPGAMNNRIWCEVKFVTGEIRRGSLTLQFGEISTAGTSYAFNIDFVGHNTCVYANSTDKVKIKATFEKVNGEVMTVPTITWSWVTSDSYKNDDDPLTSGSGIEIKGSGDEIELFYSGTTVPSENYSILQATISNYAIDNGLNSDLTAYLPIPIAYQDYNYISGATRLVYAMDNQSVSKSNDDYRLYQINDNKEAIEVENTSWYITSHPSTLDGIPELREITEKIGDKEITRYTIRPVSYTSSYIPLVNINCVIDENIVWSQPILILSNAWESDEINDWNGAVEIDEKDGNIKAPFFVTGKKEKVIEDGQPKNRLTGLVIGDLEKASVASGTGIYGFYQGRPRYYLTDSGKFYVGKDNNFISFNEGFDGRSKKDELLIKTQNFILDTDKLKINSASGIKLLNNKNEETVVLDNKGNAIIGNWKINAGAISSTVYNKDGKECTVSLINTNNYYHSGGTSGRASDVLVVYDASNTSNPYPFSLWKDGTLNCTKAKIEGTVTAKEGKIADYLISGAQLIGNNVGLSGTSGQGWAFWAGSNDSGSAPFRVGHDGSLRATKADIEGVITAKEGGKIGNWYIGTDYLQGTWGNNYVKIKVPDNTSDNTFLDVKYNGTFPFVVTKTGHLTATDAEITGTINAGSIIVGGTKLRNGVLFGTNGYSTINDRYDDNYPNDENKAGTLWRHTYSGNWIWLAQSGVHTNCDLDVGGNIHIGASSIDSHFTDDLSHFQINDLSYIDLIINGSKKLWCKSTGGVLNGTWTTGSSITVTSDINAKNTINPLSDIYSILFDNFRPVTYKYNDGTSNRLHTGFIAQEVYKALQIAGISSQDFAGLIIPNENTDDEFWTLRYEEFIALNTWQIQKLKTRVTELENEIKEIKQRYEI